VRDAKQNYFMTLYCSNSENSHDVTTPNPSNEPEDCTKKRGSKKILSLQLAVTELDLSKAVREAFELAKGAGLELDLEFNASAEIATMHSALRNYPL
jgi:hypothetical protein